MPGPFPSHIFSAECPFPPVTAYQIAGHGERIINQETKVKGKGSFVGGLLRHYRGNALNAYANTKAPRVKVKSQAIWFLSLHTKLLLVLTSEHGKPRPWALLFTPRTEDYSQGEKPPITSTGGSHSGKSHCRSGKWVISRMIAERFHLPYLPIS